MNYFLNFENFVYKLLNNRFLNLINIILTFFCIILLIKQFESFKNLQFITLNNSYTVFFLVFISYILQSLSWSILNTNSINKYQIFNWLNSNLGKYLPFKVGVVGKRLLNDKIENVSKTSLVFKFTLFEQFFIFISPIIFYLVITLKGLPLISFFLLSAFLIFRFKSFTHFNSFILYFLSEIIYLFALSLFINNFNNLQSMKIAIIYMLSSVLSIVVFTAPAGLGVREMLFVKITSFNNLYSPAIFTAIVSFRIILIFVDILIFITSYLLKGKFKYS